MDRSDFPAPEQGLLLTHFIVVSDIARSREFYTHLLDIPIADAARRHIRDFDLAALQARTIVTDRHCFGCTAGTGSSCGGATAEI